MARAYDTILILGYYSTKFGLTVNSQLHVL